VRYLHCTIIFLIRNSHFDLYYLYSNTKSQDKEGRYRYSYYENGKQKSFYSWKLESTDKLPAGKKECVSLREQIEKLQKKQLLYGKYSESSYTVFDLSVNLTKEANSSCFLFSGTITFNSLRIFKLIFF